MLAGMADGSVRFLSKDIDPRVIEQLATINGGESVPIDRLSSPRPDAIAKDSPQAPGKPRPLDVASATPTAKPILATPNAAAQPSANPAGKPPGVGVEARLNEKVPAIRFGQTTLAELVDFMGQLAGLEITLDPQALAEAQVQPDEPLSVDLQDTTVREILESVLSEHGLGYVVEGDQVVVTNTPANWPCW